MFRNMTNTTPEISQNLTAFNIPEYLKCLEIWLRPPPNDGNIYCPAVFDRWLCWNYTLAGTVAYAQCPYEYKPGFKPNALATKICHESGSWYIHPESNKTWTDYTKCIYTKEMTLYTSISGYSISCVLLIISIAIFSSFRQLRCTRVMLHQHLFASFILSGLMWIITYTQFLVKPDIKNDNPVWCKVIHILTQYASVSNYFWMFCEGFFLHTIVVHAFSKQKMLFFACCAIGWGLPLVPVTAYVIGRSLDTQTDTLCWSIPTWAMWFLSAPVVGSLVVNFILLLNILRILLSKIRAFNSSENNQNRRAVKATLILVPLLGLQNMFTLVQPQLGHVELLAWEMTSAILVSYQGAVVALIYCFFNGEVLTVLKRKWGQYSHSYDPAMGRPSSNSTTAFTLDDTSTPGVIFKNGGSHRLAKTSTKNCQDTTEMQVMISDSKNEKDVTFKT